MNQVELYDLIVYYLYAIWGYGYRHIEDDGIWGTVARRWIDKYYGE